ncbi:MAG: putative O-methyltransferase YrrM [Flavobacterium sp.]
MIPKIKSYLKFLYKSKNQHGVHSPFVYDLITKCFYDNKYYPEYSTLKGYRNSLLENKNHIEVTDFGAGSKIFKSNTRQIAAIAKNAGISKKRAELLFRMVRYFDSKSILEIGTSLGLASSALSLGNSNSVITSLEGCLETQLKCKLQFQNFDLQNVDFVNTEFTSYFKKTDLQIFNFDLIYFDGNHSRQATLDYFEMLLPTAKNNSVWIFDDIHWSSEMEKAWEKIKNHPKVTITIDTFQWGIVFFRYEQLKEHFVIRI